MNIFGRKLISFITASAIAVSFAVIPMSAMAFNTPSADDGATNGISNGGEWSIYASRIGQIKSNSGAIDDITDSNGIVEVTKGARSAALQFDLSTKDKKDKVIKSAKLRLTPMVSKTNLKQSVSIISNDFTDTTEETQIAEFAVPRVGTDDFNKDTNLTGISSITDYPSALKNWQTDIDVTGEVIGAADKISLHVAYASGNANKSEYATCNISANNRLNGGAVQFLYSGAATDYSKWVYPQIVFVYTDEENYKAAYSDFAAANAVLSEAIVTVGEGVSAPEVKGGSTVTLETADETGLVTITNNTIVYNPKYVGTAKTANVKLTVTNGEASYSRIVPISVDTIEAHEIKFDTAKNPLGEISVTVGNTTYTDGTAYAQEGDQVTVNSGANTGYTASISVKRLDDSVSDVIAGSFTMPAETVNVSVTYEKQSQYGTTRIAATNSVSIRDNGSLQSPDLVIGANRVTFVKFDLSQYNPDVISEADMNFALTKNATLNTKAVFYVPNNDWNESKIDKNFKIDGTDATNISNFKYTNENAETAISLLNGENHAALIIPNTNDASTASEGILKDYYAASTGTQKTCTISVTDAVKTAIKDSGDGIVTFMLYSTGGGNDIYSVNGAGSLAARPSLTITESAEFLPDDKLITEIKTVEDLENFAAIVNGGNGYKGKTVTLANDLDLSVTYNSESSKSWIPIGAEITGGLKSFAGIFDGKNNTVSGMYINDTEGSLLGLFGDVSGAVKDLTVTGEINGSSIIGGIAASCDGTITNCRSNVTITAQREAGGIVGTLANEGVISDSENRGNIMITNKETYAGGIAGHNINGTVSNCRNTGKIENGMDGFRNRIGGIVGFLDNGKIEDSENTGEVVSNAIVASYTADQSQNYVGGVVGYSSYGTITNSNNSGSVCNAVDYAGGIVGYLNNGNTLLGCTNDGIISAANYADSIAGFINGYNKVENTDTQTTVYAEDGIIIVATYNTDKSLTGVEIRGSVKANDEVKKILVSENQKAFVWTSFETMKPVETEQIPAA